MGTVVSTQTTVVKERLGTFQGILSPGYNWLTPFIETGKYVNWSFSDPRLLPFSGQHIPLGDICYDPSEYPAVTKDNVQVQVDIVAFFCISDVQKAVYNTQNLYGAVEYKITTALYRAIRRLTLDELESTRIEDGMDIEKISSEVSKSWGVTIKSVNVEKIVIPEAIQEATLHTIATKRKAEAEFVKLEQEAKRKIKMAKTALDEQRTQQTQQAERSKFERQERKLMVEHEASIRMTEAEANAQERIISAKAEAEAEQERARGFATALKYETEALNRAPDLLRLLISREECRAWRDIASGSGTRLILGGPEVLAQAARVPLVQQLVSVPSEIPPESFVSATLKKSVSCAPRQAEEQEISQEENGEELEEEEDEEGESLA